MDGYAAYSTTSREGSFLKPPILVRNEEGCASYSPKIQPTNRMQNALSTAHRALTWCQRNAILSIYHLRPVPPELDGRTDAVKQRARVPFQSLWLDENKPGMYPAAAELRQMGFRSRDTTLAMLDQCKPVAPLCLAEMVDPAG